MIRTLTMCATLALASSALAQDERGFTLTLEPSSSYTFQTDLESVGDFSVWRGGLALTASIPIWEKSNLSLRIGTERSEYDFSGAAGLAPGGEPIEGATSHSFNASVFHPIDDGFSLIAGAGVGIAGEDGSDLGEAVLVTGFAAGRWKIDEDLAVTLGVGVSDRLEDDARVLPIVGVEWKIADNLRLSSTETGNVLIDGAGSGVGLIYDSTDELAFVAGVAFAAREFRLDETGPVPDGVFRDDRVVVGIGAIWEPSGAVSARLGVGAAVWSNIETLSATGTTIGEQDADPAMFVTARFRILF